MKYSALVLLVAVAGCATQQRESDVVWSKPGFGKADYDVSDRACTYDAQKTFHADNSPLRARYTAARIYEACMTSKGWNQVPRASIPANSKLVPQ
jgi:hypothetical protein